MGKTIIQVACTDQRLTAISSPLVASGGRGEDMVEFEFCPLWDGFEKTAVFYRFPEVAYHAVIVDNKCTIPHEVLRDEGAMYFGVFGAKDDIVRTSEVLRYNISKGAITKGTTPSDPTPDIYVQILAKLAAIENGGGGGGGGGMTAEQAEQLDQNTADIARLSEEIVKVRPQELTDEQKAQARTNIGAVDEERVKTLLGDSIGYFEKTGAVVSIETAANAKIEVKSKIGHENSDQGYDTATLRVTGKNLVDFTSIFGIGNTTTVDGVTITVNADGTVTMTGIHSSSGWGSAFQVDLGKWSFVYPPGTYTFANDGLPANCGLMIDARPLSNPDMYNNKSATFTMTEPWRIRYAKISIYGAVTLDATFDVAMYSGGTNLNSPGYICNEYKAVFGETVYGGEYNWNTGMLTITKDANGEIEPREVALTPIEISTPGKQSVVIASCGDENFVCGYGDDGDEGKESEYDADLSAYASIVNERQNLRTLTIGLMTDSHVDYSKDTHFIYDGHFDELNKASQYFAQDIVSHLGDILTLGYEDKVQPLATLRQFAYQFSRLNKDTPICICKGNHDDNCYGVNDGGQQVNTSVDAIITPQEWVNICTSLSYKYAVFPDDKTDAAYFYIDNERTKIRTFFLNTEDYPYEVVDGVVRYNSYYNSVISPDQVQFVADALHFEDKDDPDEWAVVICSHKPLDMTKENGKRMGITDSVTTGVGVLWGIIEAFRTKADASGTTTDGAYTYTIDADYTSKTKNGEFIANLAGHTHTDNVSKAVGNTTDPCYGYVFVTFSTNSPTNVIIDRSARVIHVCKRHGKPSYTYVDRYNVGVIEGLASSGDSEWETVDADGCFKTQWTKL